MQKKIIALAVAALASGAALAQSNVTIYGVADAAFVSSKTDNAKRTNQINSGGLSASRLGFKGVEDLGNGLKALFVLEYRLDLDQNQGVGSYTTGVGAAHLYQSGPARQQMVGLTGNFGTAVAGRLQTTGYDWAVKYDVVAGTAFSPLQNVNASTRVSNLTGAAYTAGMLIGGTTVAARADNAVAYISPSMGGVTVAVNHAELREQNATLNVDGQAQNNAEKENITANLVGVYYDNGPLSVGLVYAGAKNNNGLLASGTADKTTDWALGGSYDFGVAKLAATYQTSKTDGNGASGISTERNNAWSVGTVVPVSAAGNVLFSYAKNSVKSTVQDDNVKSWTLAYTHALSKRTSAYVGYNAIERGSQHPVTVLNATGTTAGSDTGTFITGVNHKF